MAQVWKCVKCERVEWDPQKAGDHERYYYGTLIHNSRNSKGELLHYMDDIGE